jgi:hypothetical protein
MVLDLHWHLVGQWRQDMQSHSDSGGMNTETSPRHLFNPDSPEFNPEPPANAPEVVMSESTALPAEAERLHTEKAAQFGTDADASKGSADSADAYKSTATSHHDRIRDSLFQLCTRPDGSLDPCRALELVMGRPSSSVYNCHNVPTEEADPPPGLNLQSSVAEKTAIDHANVTSHESEAQTVPPQSGDAEDHGIDREAAWKGFIRCLGCCSEDLLTSLQKHRNGTLAISRSRKAAEQWAKVVAEFGSEAIADSALSAAMAF